MEASEQLTLPFSEAQAEPTPTPPAAQRTKSTKTHKAVAFSRKQSSPRGTRPESASAATTPGLLTTVEAAGLLHVHPRTVQRLVERGELTAIHLGAAVRFDPKDLVDLTGRMKQTGAGSNASHIDSLKPTRPVRISFGDRLRSQAHERRASQA
jgi:excisionase family DNA binding protein